jgi:hypothetical protein
MGRLRIRPLFFNPSKSSRMIINNRVASILPLVQVNQLSMGWKK